MLTVPMIDWVAKLGPNRSKLGGFSIAKYGPQTGNDWQWFPEAGNGIWTNGQSVTGNDPNDANVPSNSLFQQGWVQHLVNQWGTSANGGPANTINRLADLGFSGDSFGVTLPPQSITLFVVPAASGNQSPVAASASPTSGMVPLAVSFDGGSLSDRDGTIVSVGASMKSYSNVGLKRNTTYRYRVRAYNVSGNSAYSNITGVTTRRK